MSLSCVTPIYHYIPLYRDRLQAYYPITPLLPHYQYTVATEGLRKVKGNGLLSECTKSSDCNYEGGYCYKYNECKVGRVLGL